MSNNYLKIVFLDFILELDKPGRSGLSDIVWDMASVLVELGHEVHVIGPYPQVLAPDQRVSVHTIKVPPKGYGWFGGHLWISKRLSDVAFKLQPDIIHAPEYVSIAVYNTLYPASAIRTVLTVPGNIYQRLGNKFSVRSNNQVVRRVITLANIFSNLRPSKGNPYAFFYTQCLKWAARKSAISSGGIIAISREMKQAWEATGSLPDKTFLIPYGANPQRFYYIPDARFGLGIEKDTVLLLYVGRFSREKAVLELITSAAKIQQTLRAGKVRIQLFGKGPLSTQVARTIKTLEVDDIIFHSEWLAQSELPYWYSAADALLLPSYTEGFARVIPEAMICGTPVIGSRITGTEDHVIPGKTGFLFECGDFEALSQILEQVTKNPDLLRQLRAYTQLYAQLNLTWGSIVEKITQEIYLPLVNVTVPLTN